MLARVVAIALNSYREAVRARVLYGLFVLALGTTAYSLVVGKMSLHQETRVVADLGAASISLYAVLAAIILGATSLHRELELKTLFPILTRELRRHEYLVGKYLGTVATLVAFVAVDTGAVLFLLALLSSGSQARPLALAVGLIAVFALLVWRAKRVRVFILLPWSFVFAGAMFVAAASDGPERQLVIASATLAIAEVTIVAAVATLFASFSSPYLTAVFTLCIFLVGRSADTMANLPTRLFGAGVRSAGQVLARIVPNLQVYVPARSILLGEADGVPLGPFVLQAVLTAACYSVVLLVIASLVFRRRDFT